MFTVEVDQSGRMEMSGDTIVAASDGFTVTVRVTARVKLGVQKALQECGVKPRLIMTRMFAGAIWLAIRDHLAEIDLLRIDEEYIGYEAVIKSLLCDKIRTAGYACFGDDIQIVRVGKRSPAHKAAIGVTRRQRSADKTPSVAQLLEVC